MKRVFLGIDTSNYTTSIAAVDADGNVILNLKKLLPVPQGERGLRQSDAVFLHTKAIPELLRIAAQSLKATDDEVGFEAIGYSFAPRDVEGSYMPCFLVGESVAESISIGAGAPVYPFSHQSGHIMAALYSANALSLTDRSFAAFHVSGGTTELLMVKPDNEKIISVTKIGGTLDLSAGQLLDRVGVRMGYAFPAGKFVDEAALSYIGDIDRVRVNLNGMNCNLSGAENMANKIFEKYNDRARTCLFVLNYISQTVFEMASRLREEYPDIPLLFSGGVMSSKYIMKKLLTLNGFHASPEFASDNAAGCALLAREKHKRSCAS